MTPRGDPNEPGMFDKVTDLGGLVLEVEFGEISPEVMDLLMGWRRPTPAEMEVLMHWWLMAWAGAVLLVENYEDLRWRAILSDDWNENWKRDPR